MVRCDAFLIKDGGVNSGDSVTKQKQKSKIIYKQVIIIIIYIIYTIIIILFA